MGNEILRQIWPVFVAEAREHVAAIGAGVVELARERGTAEAVESIRRIAHSLKGSAASLGLSDLEELAHAVEGALVHYDPAAGLPRETAQAILDALEAVEEALGVAVAGNEVRVPSRERLLAALRAAKGEPQGGEGTPEARLEQAVSRLCTPLEPEERRRAAVEGSVVAAAIAAAAPGAAGALAERIGAAFEALADAETADVARGAARIAGDLVRLRDLLAGTGTGGPGAPEVPGAAPADGGHRGERDERAVRVLASTLDSLTRRLELLSLAESRHGRRARELSDAERELRAALATIQAASGSLRAVGVETGLGELDAASARLHAMTGELRRLSREGQRETEQQRLTAAVLREDLRELRMVPAALALEPARRAVREAALRLGKEVEVRLEGGEVRLDRRLVDDLRAPLLHLVRNAVDHGIEPAPARREAGKRGVGTVVLRVEPRGGRVAVIVEDDGRGLDLAAIREAAVRGGLLGAESAAALPDGEAARLVFAPGLSTARTVTTVSGRGVGLDAVADAMARMRGAVEVRSQPGAGTRFELDVPLTLAASAGVLIRIGELHAIVPADAVERVLLLDDAAEARALGSVRVGETPLPFALLDELLGVSAAPPSGRAVGLVLALGSQRAVVAVDEVLGEQEVVVGALGGLAARVPHLAGASLLDDGQILGVLAPAEILRRLRPLAVARRPAAAPGRRVVVADDTVASRTVMAGVLEAAGYQVRVTSDGEGVLALLEEGPCDVLVTDVQMPRLDGLELTRRLRADGRWPSLPILLVSTLDAPADVAAGTAAGADGYLSKRELRGDLLVRLVRRLLGEGA
jgi:two-component system chemotaxis sensor kinase CheA